MSQPTSTSRRVPAPGDLDSEVVQFHSESLARSLLDEIIRRGAQETLQADIDTPTACGVAKSYVSQIIDDLLCGELIESARESLDQPLSDHR